MIKPSCVDSWRIYFVLRIKYKITVLFLERKISVKNSISESKNCLSLLTNPSDVIDRLFCLGALSSTGKLNPKAQLIPSHMIYDEVWFLQDFLLSKYWQSQSISSEVVETVADLNDKNKSKFQRFFFLHWLSIQFESKTCEKVNISWQTKQKIYIRAIKITTP